MSLSAANIIIILAVGLGVAIATLVVRGGRRVLAPAKKAGELPRRLLTLWRDCGVLPGVGAAVLAFGAMRLAHGSDGPALLSLETGLGGLLGGGISALVNLSRELRLVTDILHNSREERKAVDGRLARTSGELQQVRTWVDQVGIEQVVPKGRDQAAWRAPFVEKVSGWQTIDLLVVTGWSEFCRKGALLASILRRPPSGRIRVLFLNPDAQAFGSLSARSGNPKRVDNDYFRAVKASIAALERLRSYGGQVEYRFYNSQPIWRVYLGGSEAFVQHVTFPNNESGPVYGIAQRHPTGSFYPAFQLYFEEMWRHATAAVGRTKDACVEAEAGRENSQLFSLLKMEAAEKLDAGDAKRPTDDTTPIDTLKMSTSLPNPALP